MDRPGAQATGPGAPAWAAPPGNDARTAAAALALELVEVETSRYTDPRGVAERAAVLLELARRHRLLVEAGRARLALADAAGRIDDVRGAVESARSILLQSRLRDEPVVSARAEAVLAWCLFRMGAFGEAIVHAVESVRLLPADAPAHLRVDHTMVLALLNGLQSTDDGYIAAFDHVLAEAEQLDNTHLLLLTLNNYAFLHYTRGRAADALPLCDRIQALSGARNVPLTSTILDTIASVLLELGELQRAEDVARSNVEADVPVTEARAEPEALLTLAKILDRRDAVGEALASVARAERIATERELPEIVAMATEHKAALLARTGDYRGAFEALTVSHATWKLVRDRESEDRASTLNALFETEQARQRSTTFELLAERDALTGLWNRRHIDRVLPRLLGAAQPGEGRPVSVAIIDVDNFKRLNDARSHETGDTVLVRFGELLSRAVAEPGFTARLGGEEFLMVMPHTGSAAALVLCQQVRDLVERQRWSALTDGLAVTVSIGVATARPGGTVSTVLREADAALYRAKDAGRNRVRQAGPEAAR